MLARKFGLKEFGYSLLFMVYKKINFLKIIFFICLIFSFGFSQEEKIRIACIGNSITFGGWGNTSYPTQLQNKLGDKFEVKNFGVSARTLLRKGDFPYWNEPIFQKSKEFNPHIVIIKLGTNDSKPQNWIYKNEFYSDYVDFIAEFRKFKRNPVIYICFPTPVFKTNWGINDSTVNKIIPIIDSIRKTENTFLIDFNTPLKNKSEWFSDGVHPDPLGYEFMAQLVRDTILNGQSGIIRNFYVVSDSLHKNESTFLYWNLSKNSKATLNNIPINDIDSLKISISQTSTYKIITSGDIKDTAIINIYYFPSGKIKYFKSFPPYFEKGIIDTITLKWETGKGSLVKLNGEFVESNGMKTITQKNGLDYNLIASGDIQDSINLNIAEVEEIKYNRALQRNAISSSVEWGYFSNNVTDGLFETMWKSEKSNTQSISVELKNQIDIKSIVLNWGKNFSTRYNIIVFDENGISSSIFNTDLGDGKIDSITNISGKCKVLKIIFLKSYLQDKPYELIELEVFGLRSVLSTVLKNSDSKLNHLNQNFPNPFNPITNISFSLPSENTLNDLKNKSKTKKEYHVVLKIFDSLGREIAQLKNENMTTGKYNLSWDAKNVSNGIYFCCLSVNGNLEIKKLILQK